MIYADPAIIGRILRRLEAAYGKRPRFVKTDPVDEVVRTVLSQNTSDRNSLRAFDALKRSFPRWETVAKAGARKIASVIRSAGLSDIKARRIRAILNGIAGREGRLDLSRLARLKPSEAYRYLVSFDGIGPKTASCVLLFSFGMPIMPVDTHIFRVAKRLGLIPASASVEEAHGLLTRMVPRRLIYDFHLSVIEHGRRTCIARRPRCPACVLNDMCPFAKRVMGSKGSLRRWR